MRFILPSILTLSIIGGQIVKIPLGTHGGMTLLDATLVVLNFLGLIQIKFDLKKPPTLILSAMVFILLALLSLALTPLHLTFEQYLTSFFYTVRFSLYLLLGWLILSGALVTIKENLHKILLTSGAGLAILGLLQFILLPDLQFLQRGGWDPHYLRTVSTFLDPNFAGAYFTLTLLLMASHLGGIPDRTPRIYYLLFTACYFALLTTFSRSSYAMFLTGGLVLAVLKKSKHSAFIIMLLFLGLMLGFYLYTQTISTPRNIDRTQSASSRLSTWQQGLAMMQKYPILGVGYNSYRYALKELNLADEQFIQNHGASGNDSSLLFVLSTMGILGFISYLFFLVSLVKQGGKLLKASLAGLLVHSFFANSLFYPPILLWIVLIFANPKK